MHMYIPNDVQRQIQWQEQVALPALSATACTAQSQKEEEQHVGMGWPGGAGLAQLS